MSQWVSTKMVIESKQTLITTTSATIVAFADQAHELSEFKVGKKLLKKVLFSVTGWNAVTVLTKSEVAKTMNPQRKLQKLLLLQKKIWKYSSVKFNHIFKGLPCHFIIPICVPSLPCDSSSPSKFYEKILYFKIYLYVVVNQHQHDYSPPPGPPKDLLCRQLSNSHDSKNGRRPLFLWLFPSNPQKTKNHHSFRSKY